MITGIYTITNNVTKHIYVGAASNITKRLNDHLCSLRKNIHVNDYMQNSWNKYGEEYFTFELLKECNKEYLYSEEHYWCNILDTHNRKHGYNLKPTHPNNISLVLQETRDKLRIKATGRKWSENYKQLFRENQIGRKHSPEHIYKAASGKYKIVFQFSKTGEFIQEWNSAITASKELNINRTAISNCCVGKLKTSGGYIWRYSNTL